MILRLRGADVYGLDVVDSTSARPKWLNVIGGIMWTDVRCRQTKLRRTVGPMDLVLDATGIAALEFNLLDALARNGVYVLTGIPGGDSHCKLPARNWSANWCWIIKSCWVASMPRVAIFKWPWMICPMLISAGARTSQP